ncbi:MAG: single-stranded DNA-binding protein, partial [Acetobacteraceae bacterium]
GVSRPARPERHHSARTPRASPALVRFAASGDATAETPRSIHSRRETVRTTNLFILRGRVGQAPKAFNKAAKINVATDRTWTDGKGERREETDWVTVTILNEKAAEWAIANVAKGDAVYAECRIADGSYKKDGETVYTTDIIANVFHKLDLGSRDDAAA